MTDPRLSTVYDYSNLRLHPDGTRVYQKSNNVRPHLVKITSRNPRLNWIARDAGGSGVISEFRRSARRGLGEGEGEEEEDIDELGVKMKEDKNENDEEPEEPSDGDEEDEEDSEIEGGKRKLKQHIKRNMKRQKFAADFDYLQDQAFPPLPPPPANDSLYSSDATNLGAVAQGSGLLPEPSADLLKYIHRFSSEFYTERGQLLNISRQFRKERKLRRLEKLAKRERRVRGRKARESDEEESGSSGSGSSEDEDEEEEEDERGSSGGSSDEEEEEDKDRDEDEGEGEGEDEDEDEEKDKSSTSEVDEEGNSTVEKKPRKDRQARRKDRWRGRQRAEQLYTDMYKMFDGSAIMALGMLVQETIAQMLDPEIPEGWKEEVENMYGMEDEEGDEEEDDGNDEDEHDEDKGEDEGDEGDDEDEDEEEDEEDEPGEDFPKSGKKGESPKSLSDTQSGASTPQSFSHSEAVYMNSESAIEVEMSGPTQSDSDESQTRNRPVSEDEDSSD